MGGISKRREINRSTAIEHSRQLVHSVLVNKNIKI